MQEGVFVPTKNMQLQEFLDEFVAQTSARKRVRAKENILSRIPKLLARTLPTGKFEPLGILWDDDKIVAFSFCDGSA